MHYRITAANNKGKVALEILCVSHFRSLCSAKMQRNLIPQFDRRAKPHSVSDLVRILERN
jgi:hypothetical protein